MTKLDSAELVAGQNMFEKWKIRILLLFRISNFVLRILVRFAIM